jgi:deoxyadenosine/deoxycytidine kinase
MSIRYLIIAGPIGVGKSTLTQRVHESLGFVPQYEEPDKNPYIEDFYASQYQEKAFETQLSFLGQRLHHCRQIQERLHQGQRVVQDRSIYEDCHIFTAHHYQQGLISERDFQTYQYLYQGMIDFLPQPDRIVYLSAPVSQLLDRISERGRDYEQEISSAYLEDLNSLYAGWFKRAKQKGLPIVELSTHQLSADQVFQQLKTHLTADPVQV